MIKIKDKVAIQKMAEAGTLLAQLFEDIKPQVQAGVSTLQLDQWIESELKKRGLVSQTKGYAGYRHASCISMNDEVVHGVPCAKKVLKEGDLVKIDICASFKGYCADMARPFFVGVMPSKIDDFVRVAHSSLKKGIASARVGGYLSDISAAIQQEVEKAGYGVVRDFAGHGIGKSMHEEPELPNYGVPGKGPLLRHGTTLAIEPMITLGHYDVYVEQDGWTVKTVDKSLATHIEDTIVILEDGPRILTTVSTSL